MCKYYLENIFFFLVKNHEKKNLLLEVIKNMCNPYNQKL